MDHNDGRIDQINDHKNSEDQHRDQPQKASLPFTVSGEFIYDPEFTESAP